MYVGILALYAGVPDAASSRAAGDAADHARDWARALEAWRACADGSNDRDARYCGQRAAGLAPHAADAFAGWSALESVRRDYRTLGQSAGYAKVERALAEMPESPAAPAMRLWLQNEHTRRGDVTRATDLAAEIAADPGVTDTERAFVAGREAAMRSEEHRRLAGLGCAAVGLAYGLYALAAPRARRATFLWRSASFSAAFLAVPPVVLATLYDPATTGGFVLSGVVASLCVLLAGRAPPALAATGTVGALGAVAWLNGWFPSLGLFG